MLLEARFKHLSLNPNQVLVGPQAEAEGRNLEDQ